MKQGQIVGALDLFNDPTLFDNGGYLVTSSMVRSDRGCVLRLPFQAYYKHVYLKRLPPKKKIIPVNFVDEDHIDEEILETLTEEDHQVFDLRKLGRTLIPSTVFKAMIDNDLIGSRANDRGSTYINRLEYGRQLQLSNVDINSLGLGCVYIVLKGSCDLLRQTSQVVYSVCYSVFT